MVHFIIILVCILGLTIHARVVSIKDKFTYIDYWAFCFLVFTPIISVVDWIFG